MTTKLIVCGVCIYGGLWLAAFISEMSLRNENADTQGRLLKGLAPFRMVHLFGFPAILLLAFYLPHYVVIVFPVYFAVATALVWFRLRHMGFPSRLRMLQVASTATVFIGVTLGMVAVYVL